MSNDDSNIAGAVVDSLAGLGKDIGKQAFGSIVSLPKQAGNQLVNKNSIEEEQKKKAEHEKTFHRVKEIEAQIAAIRQQNAQKKGPEVTEATHSNDALPSENSSSGTIDEASRQAIGKSELGRNYKG